MKRYAVIVGAGSGQRMGSATPKQFLMLHRKPVIWYTIQAFLHAYPDINIILVLPEERMDQAKKLLNEFADNKKIHFLSGGSTRFHSVQKGLKLVVNDAIVFVHDAVRCLVSTELIRRCSEQALIKGSAIPAITATDSIRIVEGENHYPADRNNIRIIQTPQTFLSNILLPAYGQDYDPAFTDEATVVEAYGSEIHLIEGEVGNIKITRPLDLIIAKKVLKDHFLNHLNGGGKQLK